MAPAPQIVMNPNDPTLTHGSQQPDDSSEAEWNAGMAAAFGPAETRSFHPAEPEAETILAGKYRLSERIGEGGMGSVWVAHQSEPVKRKVAVKLIKAGMDSKSVLARFEAERQALAVMDHPNIAKVLDGGLHDGRPFFVMELVKGVPITEYCDARKLTPKERLELFVPVCQAIQHAHQKGIIHRDIKPSNVLVALYDDRPVPKVIDFGIAKATGGTLTEHTLETAFGGVVGTPQYMSPEQASLNNLDIDTRSDVYSLGVLLYELLTGSPPFARQELEKKGILEILRVVREEEPPRPSTKLSTADALPSLSASRGTEPKKLTGLLRNELDWIVMKALEKDRTRRYETANGFAADVQRYLAGEPVQAHPPSRSYRLKKFVRRNRGQVIAASVVLLTLIAGVVGTTLGLVEARKQKTEARKQEGLARDEAEAKEKARAEEAKQRAVAEAEQKRANEEKQIAQAVKDFLRNKLLAQADIRVQMQRAFDNGESIDVVKHNPTIRDALDLAAKELAADKIEIHFPKQPLVQAEILETVGVTYTGIYGVGVNAPLNAQGKDKTVDLLQRSVQLFRQHLGPDHASTLRGLDNLAAAFLVFNKPDQALPILEEILRRRKATLRTDHVAVIGAMHNLATCYGTLNKHEEAIQLYEEALGMAQAKLGPVDERTSHVIGVLSSFYIGSGQINKGLALLEESVKDHKSKLGLDHESTLLSIRALAYGCISAGKPDLAVVYFEEVFQRKNAKFGPDHANTLIAQGHLGSAYAFVGRFDKSITLLEEAYTRQKAKLGPDNPFTIQTLGKLTQTVQMLRAETNQLVATGKVTEALPSLSTLSAADPKDTALAFKVAALQVWFGKDKEYAETVTRALRFARDTKEVTTAERSAKLSSLRPGDDPEKRAMALALATKAVELGKTSPYLGYFQMALGMAQYRSGLFAEADATFASLAEKEKNNKHITHTVGFYRAISLFRLGKVDEAKILATATTAAMRPLPADDRNPLADNANADDIIIWLAYREAKALLKFEAEARKSEPKAKEPKK